MFLMFLLSLGTFGKFSFLHSTLIIKSEWMVSQSSLESLVPPGFPSTASFWAVMEERARNLSYFPREDLEVIQQRRQSNGENGSSTKPKTVVPVVHWPMAVAGKRIASQKHLFWDGIQESPHLSLIQNISYYDDPNLVWIGQPSDDSFCRQFTKAVKKAMVGRYLAGLTTRWPIFVCDFTDFWITRNRCPELERIMGRDLVFYSARSIVTGRDWSSDINWVTLPKNVSSLPLPNLQSQFLQHVSFAVRTDIVQVTQKLLKMQGKDLSDPIEELPRPIDVAHFWPLETTKKSSVPLAHGVVASELRTRVSILVHQYGMELGWKTFVGLSGAARRKGRLIAQPKYVHSLLSSKIVVVTQRDQWEDHHRLMEALISGALVLSDYMHALPSGLQNGTSILLFTSPHELKSLLIHYLANDKGRLDIARRGREIAFRQHRSWHRMEEIVFGKILTTCSDFPLDSKCPYWVYPASSKIEVSF